MFALPLYIVFVHLYTIFFNEVPSDLPLIDAGEVLPTVSQISCEAPSKTGVVVKNSSSSST